MAEYVPPSKAPETEAARARLQKHTAFLSAGNAWTAAHVQDIEAGLRDGGWARQPLVRYVEDVCFQQGAVLRQIVAMESGKFQGVYLAVFAMVQQEPGYAAFAAEAKALAVRTKRETPDFHQSSNSMVVVFNHAVAIRAAFAAFFVAIAAKVGAGCEWRLGPVKNMFRALEKTCMTTKNRWRADNIFDVVRGQLVCDTVEAMAAALRCVVEAGGEVAIDRCNDRFSTPSKGG